MTEQAAAGLCSSVEPSTRVHGLTFFRGQFGVRPTAEYDGCSWRDVVRMVAGDVRLEADKARAPYFVPCGLVVAPYTGKTAERFPGQEGKQRSSSHVTPSSWFAFDIDSLSADGWEQMRLALGAAGVAFCAYSTYSHGVEPGTVRVRVLLFMDRTLAAEQWAQAWRVVNGRLLDGKADAATAKLYQLAGVWATHPSREDKAFCVDGDGALLSADALMALAPPVVERRRVRAVSRELVGGGAGEAVEKYAGALCQLDAGSYVQWMCGLDGLRAAVAEGVLSEADGYRLWMEYTASASEAAQANNEDARYCPERLWDEWSREAVPQGLIGRMFAEARDTALDRVMDEHNNNKRNGLEDTPLSAEAQGAAMYLLMYHGRVFDQLKQAGYV